LRLKGKVGIKHECLVVGRATHYRRQLRRNPLNRGCVRRVSLRSKLVLIGVLEVVNRMRIDIRCIVKHLVLVVVHFSREFLDSFAVKNSVSMN